jgi:hypothetical protein
MIRRQPHASSESCQLPTEFRYTEAELLFKKSGSKTIAFIEAANGGQGDLQAPARPTCEA